MNCPLIAEKESKTKISQLFELSGFFNARYMGFYCIVIDLKLNIFCELMYINKINAHHFLKLNPVDNYKCVYDIEILDT